MSDPTAEVRLRALISLAEKLDAANEEYPSLEAFVWNHSPRDGVHADTPLYPNLLPPYSYFRYRNPDLQPLRWNHPRQSSDVLLSSVGLSWAWVIVGDSPADDLAASRQYSTLQRHAEAVAKFLPERGDPCGEVFSILAQDERFQALGRHPQLPCWVYRGVGAVEWDDATEARRLGLTAPRDFHPQCWCAYIPRAFGTMAELVRGLASGGLATSRQRVSESDQVKRVVQPTKQPNHVVTPPANSVTESPLIVRDPFAALAGLINQQVGVFWRVMKSAGVEPIHPSAEQLNVYIGSSAAADGVLERRGVDVDVSMTEFERLALEVRRMAARLPFDAVNDAVRECDRVVRSMMNVIVITLEAAHSIGWRTMPGGGIRPEAIAVHRAAEAQVAIRRLAELHAGLVDAPPVVSSPPPDVPVTKGNTGVPPVLRPNGQPGAAVSAERTGSGVDQGQPVEPETQEPTRPSWEQLTTTDQNILIALSESTEPLLYHELARKAGCADETVRKRVTARIKPFIANEAGRGYRLNPEGVSFVNANRA